MNLRRATARLLLVTLAATFPLAGGVHPPAFLSIGPALFAAAAAAEPPPAEAGVPIPKVVGFVNDHAGVFDEESAARLEAFLDQLKRKTGAEFAVLVVPTTAPEDPIAYKTRVFQEWKLGEKGEDNGLLMLVAIEEHQVRFETGYGLEGALPDGVQSRIFREVMRPRFLSGDYAGGITAGVLAVSARVAREAGVSLEWNGRALRYSSSRPLSPSFSLMLIALIVALTIFSGIANSGGRRRRGFGGMWGGPWGGMGGGFGGGGFGGGGGGGFGGGFGGFGGGSSGGGGGGGSW